MSASDKEYQLLVNSISEVVEPALKAYTGKCLGCLHNKIITPTYCMDIGCINRYCLSCVKRYYFKEVM